MRSTRLAPVGLALALLPMTGCATNRDPDPGDFATRWIAEMDRRPPEERVPNWDEIRSLMMRPAPAVGDAAPVFALEMDDGTGTVRLAQLHANKPVVLVFGSWT